jgi:hypothetical protein
VGDQFVFTNIMPAGVSRLELYEGYRALLRRRYGYRSYRRRAGANPEPGHRAELPGPGAGRRSGGRAAHRVDVYLAHLATTGVLDAVDVPGDGVPAPPRHPPCLHLVLMHKHFYEYVRETSRALDGLIRELRRTEPAP